LISGSNTPSWEEPRTTKFQASTGGIHSIRAPSNLSLPCQGQELLEFAGQGRVKPHHLSRAWMVELDGSGMQEVALQSLPLRISDMQSRRCAVKCIAENRMPHRRKVDADLVSAARERINLEQGEFWEAAQHPVARRSLPSADAAGLHANAVHGIPA